MTLFTLKDEDYDAHPENALYKDVNWRTKEAPQRTSNFKAYDCLKVHNEHFKIASSILG